MQSGAKQRRKRHGADGGVDLKIGRQQFWDMDSAIMGGETATFGGVALNAEGVPTGSATGGPNASHGYRTFSDVGNSNFVTASNVMATHTLGLALAGWFRTSGNGDYLFGHNASSGRSSAYLVGTGKMRVTLDALSIGDSTTAFDDGNWHSYVVSSKGVNGGTGGDILYVDGVVEASHTRGFENGANPLYLAASQTGNSEFTGDLGPHGIWDLNGVSLEWAVAWHNGGSSLHNSDL